MRMSKSLFAVLLALLPSPFVTAINLQSSVQFTQVVNRAPVSLTLIVSPTSIGAGQPVTMTSTITGKPGYLPTGVVTFSAAPAAGTPQLYDYALSPAGNTASWVTTLPPGTFIATASYSGDLNYLPQVATASNPITIAPPDFSLSAPSIQDIVQGQTGTVLLSVTPINGWSGTITFTCASSDLRLNCNIPQSSLSIPNGSATPDTLNILITTFSTSVTAMAGFSMLAFAIPGTSHSLRCRLRLVVGGLALASMAGCGVPHYIQRDGTPLGPHSVVITGSSGGITHSHTLNIQVVKQ